jgi:hypothetical protein
VAITQTGSILRLPITTANSGTASSTITVPSDATFVAVSVSGYSSTSNFYSTGAMTFTKGATATAMTSASLAGDASNSAWMSAMFYMLAPDVGTNKTLAWDWAGTGTAEQPTMLSVIFYSGVDSVRSASGGQTGSSAGPYTTGTLTAVTGDLILACANGFSVVEGTVNSWSNLTLISQVAFFEPADTAWASGSPTTGSTTVAALTTTNWEDGSIVAVVLVPATASVTGTISVTAADATSAAAGSTSVTGTITVTADAATSAAAGSPYHNGTISVTAADATMTATGAASGSGDNTGTIAVTAADATSVAAGTTTVIGTVAVTASDATSTGAGSWTITGTIAVTAAAATMAASSTTVLSFAYPVAVSGRKLVDQNGATYLLRNMSAWGMAQNGSDAEITSALTSLAGTGYKSVTVWPCGGNYNDTGSGWVRYQNKAGANFFTGTPLQSSLGAAWASMDWVMTEATRLNMTVIFAVCYTGWSGGSVSQGIGDDLSAAQTVSPTHPYNYGHAVATRYAAYPNIVWELGTDWNVTSTLANAIDKVFQGIRDAEGSTHRLVVAEPDQDETSYSRFISNQGTYPTGYEWLRVSINSNYDYDTLDVEQFDAVYNETGATTLPVWDCEPPYRGGDWSGPPTQQGLRERVYTTFIRGGVGINYGDADIWPFGLTALGAGGTYSAKVAPALTRAETLEAAHAYSFADEHINHTAWAPHDSFITTGTGSGDTKAAAGSKGTTAVAYFPNNRTVVADTTIITGTANVRLRWWDPVAFTYTDIATSETQNPSRSVTLPAARGDGTRDFVLVVDTPTTGAAYIGTTPITNLRIGTTLVTKLYVGTTQII